jgi:hypothetical protein
VPRKLAGYVSHGGFDPLEGLYFARFIPGHLLVRDIQILADDMGPDE